MNPYRTFFAIHFEVGLDTNSLEHQISLWQETIDLVSLADRYKAALTLQFNPQWAEYILEDQIRLNLLNRWRQHDHEIALHHHGYDHGDWNGYTNRQGKEQDPRFRGNISEMMKLMGRLAHPHRVLSGTITDEMFDYPQGIQYDTEGILISHARSKPKWVILGPNNRVIQVSMAFLSYKLDIDNFKHEYKKSKKDEIFGLVTHEKDFAENPAIIEEWLKFIKARRMTINTVSNIINTYKRTHYIEYNNKGLTFFKDVMNADNSSNL